MATSGARAAWGGFRFARNTATTFGVFYWLQVTKLDVLLNSAPSGPDYIDILVLCLHAQLFRSSVRFRMFDRPGSRKHFDRLPFFEIARVLVRVNHVAGRQGIFNRVTGRISHTA